MARGVSRILAGAVVSVLLACSDAPSPDPAPGLEPGDGLSPTAALVVELTNVERVRAGLPPLRADARLMEAAALHAGQIAAAGRLEHTLAGAPYPTLQDRLAAAGYTWSAAGENLAFGQRSAAATLEMWMQSPPHRANILNPSFTEIGVGHATGPDGRPYDVQVFARPLS